MNEGGSMGKTRTGCLIPLNAPADGEDGPQWWHCLAALQQEEKCAGLTAYLYPNSDV